MYKIVKVPCHNYLIVPKTKCLILLNLSFAEIQEKCMDIEQNFLCNIETKPTEEDTSILQLMKNKKLQCDKVQITSNIEVETKRQTGTNDRFRIRPQIEI